MNRMPAARFGRLVVLIVTALAAGGCSTLLAVSGQQKLADTNCVISGTVKTEKPARGPLVVGLFRHVNDEYLLVDYFTASKPGDWMLAVQPGTYWIAAFEDANRDGAYEDEPFYRPDEARPIVLAPGQNVSGLDVLIPFAGRARREGHLTLSGMMARADDEQKARSLFALSKVGEVAALVDPRFSQASAELGMWKFYDFLLSGRAGIFFLEPYDPKRIPVLFVHGVNGTPLNFQTLISRLDRKRYQPWVLFYPSGSRLDMLVTWMNELFTRLELKLQLSEAVVVSHSMGGLVARGFVLKHYETSANDPIRMLVTISSPLGGMASAGEGVRKSPIIIRSWYGLAPGSEYLEGLFYTDPGTRQQRRRLPTRIAYHMMFGYRGDDSSDGVVQLSSQLRPEAQEEATSVRGYDETHVGILDSRAVSTRLNEILGEVRE
jgi:pimeloyl-ACP methyl ester carboxylesterase